MKVLAILAFLATFASPLTASAQKLAFHVSACGKTMSCPGSVKLQRSDIPQRISLKPVVKAPSVCVGNVMGELTLTDIPVCEAFLAGTGGTSRERATAYVNLGHVYYYNKDGMRKPVAALAAWDLAIKEDPTFAEPYVVEAEAAAAWNENLDVAMELFSKALAADPGHWRALMGRANLLLRLNQVSQAVETAKRAMESAPELGIAHQLYGNILRRAGRLDDALAETRLATADFSLSKRRVPGTMQEQPPWNAVADIELELHRPAHAIEAINKLIDGVPEANIEPIQFLFRGYYYEAAGNPKAAADDYERALRLLGPEYSSAERYRSRIAMLRAKSGQGKSAQQAFRDILKSGKLRGVLRLQVFLRNNGFNEVAINGKVDAALEKALERCLTDDRCTEAIGQPI